VGDRWYRVSFSRGMECACFDFKKGNVCKHIFAVGDYDLSKSEIVFREFNALIAGRGGEGQSSTAPDRGSEAPSSLESTGTISVLNSFRGS
jgi:hypothetical protein